MGVATKTKRRKKSGHELTVGSKYTDSQLQKLGYEIMTDVSYAGEKAIEHVEDMHTYICFESFGEFEVLKDLGCL